MEKFHGIILKRCARAVGKEDILLEAGQFPGCQSFHDFYRQYNGGYPNRNVCVVPGDGIEVGVDHFLPIKYQAWEDSGTLGRQTAWLRHRYSELTLRQMDGRCGFSVDKDHLAVAYNEDGSLPEVPEEVFFDLDETWIGFFHNKIAFSRDGDGNHLCICQETGRVLYVPMDVPELEPEVLAENFSQFLRSLKDASSLDADDHGFYANWWRKGCREEDLHIPAGVARRWNGLDS